MLRLQFVQLLQVSRALPASERPEIWITIGACPLFELEKVTSYIAKLLFGHIDNLLRRIIWLLAGSAG